jgi:DNA-binding transcriptional MerR regulator
MIDRDATPPGPDLLKIGDFARIADTNLRTLRYYEEMGLLIPAHRSQGGFRYYRQADVNRLNMIRDLQNLGLHLDRIRELMSNREHGDDREMFLANIRRALSEQDRLLQERIRMIEAQRARIALANRKLTDCAGCPHLPSPANNFCDPCGLTGDALPPKLSALF